MVSGFSGDPTSLARDNTIDLLVVAQDMIKPNFGHWFFLVFGLRIRTLSNGQHSNTKPKVAHLLEKIMAMSNAQL